MTSMVTTTLVGGPLAGQQVTIPQEQVVHIPVLDESSAKWYAASLEELVTQEPRVAEYVARKYRYADQRTEWLWVYRDYPLEMYRCACGACSQARERKR